MTHAKEKHHFGKDKEPGVNNISNPHLLTPSSDKLGNSPDYFFWVSHNLEPAVCTFTGKYRFPYTSFQY